MYCMKTSKMSNEELVDKINSWYGTEYEPYCLVGTLQTAVVHTLKTRGIDVSLVQPAYAKMCFKYRVKLDNKTIALLPNKHEQ